VNNDQPLFVNTPHPIKKSSLVTGSKVFAVAIAAPLLVVFAVNMYFVQKELARDTQTRLQSIRNVQLHTIDEWASVLMKSFDRLTTDATLSTALASYTEPTSVETAQTIGTLLTTTSQVQQNLIEEVTVVNADNGTVIASSDPAAVTRRYAFDELYQKGRSHITVGDVVYGTDGSKSLTVAGPMYGGNHHIVAVLLVRADLAPIDRAIESTAGLGTTGTILLVDSHFHTIATGGRRQVTTVNSVAALEPVKRAFNKETGLIVYTPPGKGSVYAAFTYIPTTEWALVVEQQTDETRALVSAFTYSFAGASALIGIIISLYVFVVLRRTVITPIKNITSVVQQIIAGDDTVEVKIMRDDEIGALARSINEINRSVRASHAQLEKSIAERTKELTKKVEETETLNQTLTNTKAAVLNILDDLDHEKKQVEEKVLHRTQELRVEKEKLALIAQSMEHGVILCDASGSVMFSNAWVQKLLQVPEDNQGAILEALLATFDTVDLAQKLRDCIAGTESDVPEIEYGQGTYEIFFRNVMRSAGSSEQEHIIWIRDITATKTIERAKDNLISLVSHQLRTPLTGVKWHTELLLEKKDALLNTDDLRSLEDIHSGTERMVDLVDSLPNVSRIELGTLAMNPQPIFIETLAMSVIEELADTATSKKLSITTEYDATVPTINLDKNYMRIVFENLLSNAIKYTPVGGTIHLSICAAENAAAITVADSGYGIPVQEQEKIFTKLFRAANVKEKVVDGNGLGLFIVRAIVHRFGGSIRFESQEGVGTTFFVTIPYAGIQKGDRFSIS
jgi:signal transduction histidine kinase